MYEYLPQLIYISLMFMHGGWALANDGKPQDKCSFKWWCISALLTSALLYWGGFFK